MDPTAAWTDLLWAVKDRDLHTAADKAQDLLNWYEKGGFHPRTAGNRTLPGLARAKDMLANFRRLYRLSEDFDAETWGNT